MAIKEKIIKLITFVLVFVLAWILYRSMIVPKRDGLNKMKGSLKNVDFQISRVLGEEMNLSDGSVDPEKLEEHLNQLVLQIPSEKELPHIINRLLTQPGKGLDIDYNLIQPQALKKEGRYKKMPINLNFATNYSSFITYLTRLRDMPEMFIIENLSLKRSPANPVRLDVNLKVAAFVMPREGSDPAKAISTAPYPEIAIPTKSPFKPESVPKNTEMSEPTADMEAQPVSAEPEIEFYLQGIIQTGEIKGQSIKAAIINDKILYIGNMISGYQVINIKTDYVVLRKGGKTLRLKLEY